jgi:hypothetical protein
MRTIEFWKTKLKLAERALKDLGPRHDPGPRPSFLEYRGRFPKAMALWDKRVRIERQRVKLEARISYFKERIEALRSMTVGARALAFPPL